MCDCAWAFLVHHSCDERLPRRKSGACAAFFISKTNRSVQLTVAHCLVSTRQSRPKTARSVVVHFWLPPRCRQGVRGLLPFRVQLLGAISACADSGRSLLPLAGQTVRAVATKDVRVLVSFLWFPPRCLVSRRSLCYRSLSFWSPPRCLPSKHSRSVVVPCIDFRDLQHSVSLNGLQISAFLH